MTDKTDRELMQQVLEALDSKHDMTNAEWRYLQYHAFNDLRERLAQPEPRNQCGETCERAKLCAVCLAEMGAQPEQDPVAYVLRTLSGKSISDEIAPTGWSTFESKIEKLRADPWVRNGIAEIIPLYTAPPEQKQREWQGLFFDVVYEAWHSAGMDLLGGDWNTFASTLKAKLKEKND